VRLARSEWCRWHCSCPSTRSAVCPPSPLKKPALQQARASMALHASYVTRQRPSTTFSRSLVVFQTLLLGLLPTSSWSLPVPVPTDALVRLSRSTSEALPSFIHTNNYTECAFARNRCLVPISISTKPTFLKTALNNDSDDILLERKYCQLFTHESNTFLF